MKAMIIAVFFRQPIIDPPYDLGSGTEETTKQANNQRYKEIQRARRVKVNARPMEKRWYDQVPRQLNAPCYEEPEASPEDDENETTDASSEHLLTHPASPCLAGRPRIVADQRAVPSLS